MKRSYLLREGWTEIDEDLIGGSVKAKVDFITNSADDYPTEHDAVKAAYVQGLMDALAIIAAKARGTA